MNISPLLHTLTVSDAELKLMYMALFMAKELSDKANNDLDSAALKIIYEALTPRVDTLLSYEECCHRVIGSKKKKSLWNCLAGDGNGV